MRERRLSWCFWMLAAAACSDGGGVISSSQPVDGGTDAAEQTVSDSGRTGAAEGGTPIADSGGRDSGVRDSGVDAPAGMGGEGLDFTPGRKCTPATIGAAAHVNNGSDLQAAVNALADGGTLVVGAGSYQGPIAIDGKKNITVCGAPGARPVVSSTANSCIIEVRNSSGVHVEGLELAGLHDQAHQYQCGIKAAAATHHVGVWDTWVHDTPSAGIAAANGAGGHLDVRYNRIWNTAAFDGYHTSAISFYELDNYGGANDANGYADYIVGNMVFANAEQIPGATDGNCIIIDDNLITQQGNRTGAPYDGRVLVVNNLCVNNGGRGIHFFQSHHGHVVNNTLYHDVRTGFDGLQAELDAYSGEDVLFLNNLSVAAASGNVFDNSAMGSTVLLSHNIFSGPSARNPSTGFTSVTDPMFVNPAPDPRSGDFRPKPGSPAVNAGVPALNTALAPKVDFNGKARSAITPSVGAFEP